MNRPLVLAHLCGTSLVARCTMRAAEELHDPAVHPRQPARLSAMRE